MSCTQDDDGWIRSHADAEQALTYAVPGARVAFVDVGSVKRQGLAREYVVTLERHGHRVTHGRAMYCLPVRAIDLMRHVVAVADGRDLSNVKDTIQ